MEWITRSLEQAAAWIISLTQTLAAYDTITLLAMLAAVAALSGALGSAARGAGGLWRILTLIGGTLAGAICLTILWTVASRYLPTPLI